SSSAASKLGSWSRSKRSSCLRTAGHGPLPGWVSTPTDERSTTLPSTISNRHSLNQDSSICSVSWPYLGGHMRRLDFITLRSGVAARGARHGMTQIRGRGDGYGLREAPLRPQRAAHALGRERQLAQTHAGQRRNRVADGRRDEWNAVLAGAGRRVVGGEHPRL